VRFAARRPVVLRCAAEHRARLYLGRAGVHCAEPLHFNRTWMCISQHRLRASNLCCLSHLRMPCLLPHPGTSELNWDLIAKHLGRGKRSVQRKYDNLKGSLAIGPPGGCCACICVS
jgi:hypothetical protein